MELQTHAEKETIENCRDKIRGIERVNQKRKENLRKQESLNPQELSKGQGKVKVKGWK